MVKGGGSADEGLKPETLTVSSPIGVSSTVRLKGRWVRLPSFTALFMAVVATAATVSQVRALTTQTVDVSFARSASMFLTAVYALGSLLLLLWCLPLGLASLSVGPEGLRRTFYPFRRTHRWRAGACVDVADLSRGETCQDAYLVWSNPGQIPDTAYGMGSKWAFSLSRYVIPEHFSRRLCDLASEHGVIVTRRAVYRLCDPVGRLGAATRFNADTPMNQYSNPHRPSANQQAESFDE